MGVMVSSGEKVQRYFGSSSSGFSSAFINILRDHRVCCVLSGVPAICSWESRHRTQIKANGDMVDA